jgi:hypothetical protein
MPLCSFPDAWNTAPGDKQNPDQNLSLKELKNYLLQSIIDKHSNNVLLTILIPFPLSPPPPFPFPIVTLY